MRKFGLVGSDEKGGKFHLLPCLRAAAMESRLLWEGIDINSHSIKAIDEPISFPLTVERRSCECWPLTNQGTVAFTAIAIDAPN